MLSDAPEGLRNSLEVAVVTPAGTGVFEPDGVRVRWAGLAGDMRPVGVLGRELEPFVTPRRRGVTVPGVRLTPVLLGILDGVSSVLSSDRFEPCLEGGLLPGLLPCLEAGCELGLDPPGVKFDLYDIFLGVRSPVPSVSDCESGVPAVLGLDIGTERPERSLTLVIGPAGVRTELSEEPEGELAVCFDLKADIV